MTHLIGICLIIGSLIIASIIVIGQLEKWRIRREEDRQRDAFLPDTQLISRDSWDGATYAYPQQNGYWPEEYQPYQAWQEGWPQDMSVTQFLNAAPPAPEPPVMGIRTSGPFQQLDDIEDTEAWIRKMRADSDAVIARLCAPVGR